MSKTILHLCADTGSDSKPYKDAGYDVRLIGSDIGVENYEPPENVYGIFANPPCTNFSALRTAVKSTPRDEEEGMRLVKECQRIIKKANPKFWVIENPATGLLGRHIGKPRFVYQPWEFGSPWTKKTALWGKFNIPEKIYQNWEDVPKLEGLYTRPNRQKPALNYMHARTHMKYIPEFTPFLAEVTSKPSRVSGGVGADMEFRSLCSQKFAKAFYEVNK